METCFRLRIADWPQSVVYLSSILKNNPENLTFWQGPILSIQQLLKDPALLRTDQLEWTGNHPAQRSAYLHLMQLIRHRSLVEHLIQLHVKKLPKPKLRAVLSLAVVQMLEAPNDNAHKAKCIHHTVDIARVLCSNQEAKFVNAVSRSISQTLDEQLERLKNDRKKWYIYYSHPKWLIERWVKQNSPEAILSVLQWNQKVPITYANDVHRALESETSETGWDALGLKKTQWPDFYALESTDRKSVESLLQHPLYIQDPSTAIAPSLFEDETSPRSILDACASPGGKSVHLFKRLKNLAIKTDSWWAADLNRYRLELYESNMDRLGIRGVKTAEVDWEKGVPMHLNDGNKFDWILLDAPCSSVGVIQKHPEIRWRLRPDDYKQLPTRQLNILQNCAQLLTPGGELVYSTCSFDQAENLQVIDSFLKTKVGADFELKSSTCALPGQTGHDGIGAFLLKKTR